MFGSLDVLASGVSTSTTSIRCALGLSFYWRVWGDLLLLVGLFLLSTTLTVAKNVMLRLERGLDLQQELLGCAVLVVYLQYPSINEGMFSGIVTVIDFFKMSLGVVTSSFSPFMHDLLVVLQC